MDVLYMLIGFSALVALVFLAAFVWSVKREQYEDTYGPPVRMLFDDELKSEEPEK